MKTNNCKLLGEACDKEFQANSFEEIGIKLIDLENAKEITNTLFRLLCFDYEKSVPGLGYFVPNNNNDLDNILNILVKESDILNMPEQQPGFWKTNKENFNEQDIIVINDFREKNSLPKI